MTLIVSLLHGEDKKNIHQPDIILVSAAIKNNISFGGINSSKEVLLALKSIRDNYSLYQENCRKFTRENSWEKASLNQ